MTNGRAAGDAGTGLISTIGGLLVFLALLLFAVQTLISLFTRSAVTDAAYEGARLVAGARSSHDGSAIPEDARVRAEQIVRGQLGRLGPTVELDWSSSDADTVALRVRARPPGFLWSSLGAAAPAVIDRTVRVRVERWR